MKLFLTLMAGENALDAEPIFASADPALIDAVMHRLGGMIEAGRGDAPDKSNDRPVEDVTSQNRAAGA